MTQSSFFRQIRTLFPLGLLLAASLTVSGCAVGPDYQVPEIAVPAHWSGAKPTATPDLKRWWRGLGDRVLDGLIEEAVAGNLDVAAAKARIRAARASRRQAIGSLFPTVDGDGSVTRSKTADPTATESASPQNLFKAGFDASFELDVFGANRRDVEAASRAVEAAEDGLDATLLTLLGDVAANYVEARGYQARIALARRTAKSQRDTADLTRTKFDAGSASAVDVAKATAQAASTEAKIPVLETAYAQAVHRLGVLLGRDPGALSARLKREAPIPSPRRTLRAGIPADVLSARPDVRRAERLLAQSTARIGAAEAALYPSVSLTGSISTAALKSGDVGKNSTIGWSYGPALSVPIFNGGKLRAAVEVAEAERDQYHVALRAAVLTALEDVENAMVSLANQRQTASRLSESTRNYRDAARLSRSLYQSGTVSFLDVLDAERSLYSAEDALLESRVAIGTDYIALAKALGGGWSETVDASKPEVVDVGTQPHVPDWRALSVDERAVVTPASERRRANVR
jgi:NodT family efflux transporter outer membrane factor (OMF) lipoprotein